MKAFVCTLLMAVCAMTALAADASGKWSGTFAPEGQTPSAAFVVLKQTGKTLTGSAGPNEGEQWPLSNGKLDGSKLTGDVTSPDGAVYKLDLVLEGEHIKGNITMSREGQTRKGTIELTRLKG